MLETKYTRMLTWILIGGIILILAVLGGSAIIITNNSKLKREAEEAVVRSQNENEIIENNIKQNTVSGTVYTNDVSPIITPENVVIPKNTGETNNTKTYKGFAMSGTIEIPAIGLSYPVLSETSKVAMETSLTVYFGPGLNQIGNTIIAGHNYKDGTMLSNLKKIVEGDKIYITDETGRKLTYSVYKAPYITNREDSSYFDRDTEGKREISITSCTDDVKNVYVVWAREQ